ncbi:HTH domain-containing protein, partial [Clostridioides difficile]
MKHFHLIHHFQGEERVIYIYSVLLKSNDYITIQQLSDELYISRGTIERDLAEV